MLHSYFIIEKDLIAINNIQVVLEEFPELTCIGVTENYEEGMNAILKKSPDVVFIDVDSDQNESCPDAFSYCDEINKYISRKPLYIALSKTEKKAYRALKNNFFDYIIKPGKELELRKTVLQMVKKQQFFLDGVLCLKSYKDFTLLEIDNVIFLQADNNATDIVLQGGNKICAFHTLKSFESVLPNNFIRIHHSYIVNKNHISRINFGKLRCFLNHNKINLPFSKSYRHNLHTLEQLLLKKAITFN